jgi:hypothetical protein
MKVELLYFEGCPHWREGLENLKAALAEEHIIADINLVKINDDDDADREKFLGSPSFRINGKDLWPEERQSYRLGCRIYQLANGMHGYPTVTILREKIRAA